MAASPLASQPSVQERILKYRLAVCAIPCGHRDAFVDFTSRAVADYMNRSHILPQRPVHDVNVAKLAESLRPGSLASSLRTPGAMVLFPLDFWQDEGERAVVAAARTELFRVLTVRDGDTSPTDGRDQPVPPEPQHRPRDPVHLDLDLVRRVGLYIADGNHRVAALELARKAREFEPGEPPFADDDLRLYFEVFTEDIMNDPASYLSISIERNQVASFTSIKQFRHLLGAVTLTRLARVEPDGATKLNAQGASSVNDFGAYATARYRFEILEQASRHHPVASFLLENLPDLRLDRAMGYGKNGFGIGCIFILMALEETARWYGIMDPAHKLLGSMMIFKSLSRRLQKNPRNPLEKYQPPADARPHRLPKAVVDASAAIGKAIQNWKTSTGLKNESKAVCEEAWRLGRVFSGTEAEADWPAVEITPPPAPVIGILLDIPILGTLGDTVIDLTQDEDSLQSAKTVKKRRLTTEAGAKFADDVRNISRNWLRHFASALAVLVPSSPAVNLESPLRPPRPGWDDPFLLLHVLADENIRERIARDPFAPGTMRATRFDTLPATPFLEDEKHAAIAKLLAAFVWTERVELLREYEAARAWTREPDTPADFGRCFVWNYPVHHRLAKTIESQYGKTSLLLSPSVTPSADEYDSSARPVKGEPGASRRSDAISPVGKAAGSADAFADPSDPQGRTDSADTRAHPSDTQGQTELSEDEAEATSVAGETNKKKRRIVSDDEDDNGQDPPHDSGGAASSKTAGKRKKTAASASAAGKKGSGAGAKSPNKGAALDDAAGDNEGDQDEPVTPEDGTGTPGIAARQPDASAAAVDSLALMHALRFIAGHAASLNNGASEAVLAWDVKWRPEAEVGSALYKRALFAYVRRHPITREDGTIVECGTIMWDKPPDSGDLNLDSIREGKDPDFSAALPCQQPDLFKFTVPALGVLAALTTVLVSRNPPKDTLSALARTPSPRIFPLLPETEPEATGCLRNAFAHVRSADGDTAIRARLGAMQDGQPFRLPARLRHVQELPPECFQEWGSAARAMLKVQSCLSAR